MSIPSKDELKKKHEELDKKISSLKEEYVDFLDNANKVKQSQKKLDSFLKKIQQKQEVAKKLDEIHKKHNQ